jgi:hypothetical protein
MTKQPLSPETITVRLIVAAAGICVGFITAYLFMFDSRGIF